MSKAGDVFENPVTGEFGYIRVGTKETNGRLIVADLRVRPGGAVLSNDSEGNGSAWLACNVCLIKSLVHFIYIFSDSVSPIVHSCEFFSGKS
jgi:hypothetical protein